MIPTVTGKSELKESDSRVFKMDFNKIEEILCCPICQELSLPPIYQCWNGHVICSKCIPCITDALCPICRTEMPSQNIRALTTEQLIETMEVKCKHCEEGCRTLFTLGNAKAHLEAGNCCYE